LKIQNFNVYSFSLKETKDGCSPIRNTMILSYNMGSQVIHNHHSLLEDLLVKMPNSSIEGSH